MTPRDSFDTIPRAVRRDIESSRYPRRKAPEPPVDLHREIRVIVPKQQPAHTVVYLDGRTPPPKTARSPVFVGWPKNTNQR